MHFVIRPDFDGRLQLHAFQHSLYDSHAHQTSVLLHAHYSQTIGTNLVVHTVCEFKTTV